MTRAGERIYGSPGAMRRNAVITLVLGAVLLVPGVLLAARGNAAGWFLVGLVLVGCGFVFFAMRSRRP
ncbi:hypothetical protein [Actinacidiphila acidipaludis]|uniref:Uncharacterized protein n=1 Tax=Actinacidiphila acidipaludis TaxID=2873382 RepID=A0ABS7QHG2_9ACTN|nr:hypothetical protein [Streptomyces acidipaludis]MBY8882595.1 hypothetical protein [Streptomyces acidipaludis]